MKKAISLLLGLVMCLSLCACGGGNNNKAIVGEWKAVSCDASAVFNEDGSGELSGSFLSSGNFTWKYDKELKCYVVASSQSMNITVKTVNEVEYISLGGIQFFRVENYDHAIQITVNDRKGEIAKLIEGKTKLEFGVAYDLGNDASVVFNAIPTREGELFNLVLEAAVTNNGTSELEHITGLIPSYTARYYLYDAPNGTTSNGGAVFGSGQNNVPANETVILSSPLMTKKIQDVEKALDVFGEVVGVLCFEMNGTEYYIDYSELITK